MNETVAAPVRVPKRAEAVADRLRRAIIRGELAPGDQLPAEAMLSIEHGVSRPTLREAIRILESEQLVSVLRGAKGGVRVKPVGTDMLTSAAGRTLQAGGATLRDIYDVRTIIEPPAARLAAERCDPAVVEALRSCVVRSDSDLKPTLLVADFHRLLLEGCGNVALAMVGQVLHNIVEQHMRDAGRDDRRRSANEHAKRVRLGLRSQSLLVDLIARGDADGAEAHWRQHMRAASRSWLAGAAGAAVIDVVE